MTRKPLVPPWTRDDDPRRIEALKVDGLDRFMNPLIRSQLERQADQLIKEQTMSDQPAAAAAATSPTGTPVVAPHTIAFKVMAVVMAIAGAVALKQPDLFPSTEVDQQVATILMAVIGFVSPGLRKK